MAEGKTKLPLSEIPSTFLEIVHDLPLSYYRNIGKIISAHAILEAQVLDTLCVLTLTKFSIGYVVLRYQAASERFKTIRKLLVLHGIRPTANLKALSNRIQSCCRTRDAFAHGTWVRTKEGKLGLRLTKGEYETDDGTIDRSFVPQVSTYSTEYYEKTRKLIIDVGWEVHSLREEIGVALKGRRLES